MISVSKKYFAILILTQILIFLLILGFIGITTWSYNENGGDFISHSSDFKFTIDENFELRYLDMPQRGEISCFVTTTPENNFARSAIRRTWGKIIKPIFVMSKNGEKFKISLENESKVFGDMLVIDHDFELLSEEKIFVALKFFIQHFNASQYFMMARDDVIVSPKNLYDLLNKDEDVRIVRRERNWSKLGMEEKISLMIVPGKFFKLRKMTQK